MPFESLRRSKTTMETQTSDRHRYRTTSGRRTSVPNNYWDGAEQEGYPETSSKQTNRGRRAGKYRKQTKQLFMEAAGESPVMAGKGSCRICGVSFRNRTIARQHYDELHSAEDDCLKCQRCSQLFDSVELLLQHCKDEHPTCSPKRHKQTQRVTYCHGCKLQFDNESEYIQHRQEEHPDAVKRCCNLTFTSNPSYELHMLMHHGILVARPAEESDGEDESTSGVCRRICGITFRTGIDAEEHYKDLHMPETDAIKCKVCSEEYKTVKSLLKHHKKEHPVDSSKSLSLPESKTFCRRCKLHCNSPEQYIQHRLDKHPSIPKRCCNMTFSKEESFILHMLAYHSVLLPGQGPEPRYSAVSSSSSVGKKLKASASTNVEKEVKVATPIKAAPRIDQSDIPMVRKVCLRNCKIMFRTKAIAKEHYEDFHIPKSNLLRCKVCSREFESLQTLFQHHKSEHPLASSGRYQGPKVTYCHGCKLQLRSPGEYLKHRQDKHPKAPKRCCNLTFAKGLSFPLHMFVYHSTLVNEDEPEDDDEEADEPESPEINSTSDVCRKMCGITFRPLTNADEHYKQFHSPGSKCIKCTVCSKEYKAVAPLIKHYKSEHPDLRSPNPPFRLGFCRRCKLQFNSHNSYLKHRLEAHPNAAKSCCGMTFSKTKDESFFLHRLVFHSSREEDGGDLDDAVEDLTRESGRRVDQDGMPLDSDEEGDGNEKGGSDNTADAALTNCQVCEIKFRTQQECRDHQRDLHSAENGRLECKICSREFDTTEGLLQHCSDAHSSICSITKGGPFRMKWCKGCRIKFPTREEYLEHRKVEHPSTTHLCCKMTFYKEEAYFLHLITDHSQYRAHVNARLGKTSDQSQNEDTAKGDDNSTLSESWRQAFEVDLLDFNAFASQSDGNRSKPTSLRCRECGEIFTSEDDIDLHRKTSHPELPANKWSMCKGCGLVFRTEEGYMAHRREAHNDRYTNCKTCGESFATALECYDHRRLMHINQTPITKEADTDGKTAKCNFCSFVGTPFAVQEHFMQNHYSSLYIATGEEKEGEPKYYFSAGDKVAKSIPEAEVRRKRCQLCLTHYDTHKAFVSHRIETHLDYFVECKFCRLSDRPIRIFVDNHALTLHKAGAHPELYPNIIEGYKATCLGKSNNVCQVCGKLYHLRKTYLNHVAFEHGPKVVCPLGCGKTIKCSYDLHLNVAHCESFMCDICGKSIPNRPEMYRHKLTHSGETFPCTWPGCGKVLKTKKILRLHVMVHQDLKPVACKHCSYRCRQHASLHFHMKTHHKEAYVQYRRDYEENR